MLFDALTKLSLGAGKSSATKIASKSSSISFGNNNVAWEGLPPPPPPPPKRDAPPEEDV
ncbi:hypothetical protein ACTFIV_004136 [Dictyostelium citrinum]